MLDQNTDRMWFVIGAVIVGAALIFIANGTIPDIFASVTESFEEVSEKGTAVIDDLTMFRNPNLLGEGLSNNWMDINVGGTAYSFSGKFGYYSLDELGVESGDELTLSFEHEFGEAELRGRLMFSPGEFEPDDYREKNTYGSYVTGSGHMEYSMIVPDGVAYFIVRVDNQRRTVVPDGGIPVRVKHLKLERGSDATPY